MKKVISVLSTAFGLALILFALPVEANNSKLTAAGSPQEVRISATGETVVRGAEVTAVSGSVITAVTDIGGVDLTWRVETEEADFAWVR